MKSQQGQTLIEVLIGLAATVIVMAAITTATLTALNNSQSGRNQNLAENYATQGIEVMRNLHSADFNTFSSLSGTYCFAKECNSIDTNPANTGKACAAISGNRCPGILNAGNFIRTVTFHTTDPEAQKCNDGGAGGVKVDVTVEWNDSKCTNTSNLYCHSVDVSSCFNDSQVIPTP